MKNTNNKNNGFTPPPLTIINIILLRLFLYFKQKTSPFFLSIIITAVETIFQLFQIAVYPYKQHFSLCGKSFNINAENDILYNKKPY